MNFLRGLSLKSHTLATQIQRLFDLLGIAKDIRPTTLANFLLQSGYNNNNTVNFDKIMLIPNFVYH